MDTEIVHKSDLNDLQKACYMYLFNQRKHTLPLDIAALGPQNSIVSLRKMLGRQWYNNFFLMSSVVYLEQFNTYDAFSQASMLFDCGQDATRRAVCGSELVATWI
mgnify:CR=1 FL=1